MQAKKLTLVELQKLHPGHSIAKTSGKERIRVCVPTMYDGSWRASSSCETCHKDLGGEKCVRHEKGSIYLFWECFECYVKNQQEEL